MTKKYINVKDSVFQHEADNWLMMIPADQINSDSKIVYIALKKMQDRNFGSMTDANSWFKITGLKMERIKECLNQLESFGLIEQYHSTKNANTSRHLTTFTAFLLDHFLMKGIYPVIPCPHDGLSFKDVHNPTHLLRNSPIGRAVTEMKEFANQVQNGAD